MKTNTPQLATVALAVMLAVSAAGPGLATQQPQQPTTTDAPVAEKEKTKKRGGPLSALFGQGAQDKNKSKSSGTRPAPTTPASERLEPDETTVAPTNVSADMVANRHEQLSEEAAAIVPYYNNFMASYRLGPEDIISVAVFGQERYSRANIVVPPDGIINLQLIPQGVLVVGKTTRQVAEEIAKHYDEYIIDPKVTVTLEKAMSSRFAVLGDVVQPGIKVLSRRLSVSEALAEAGGVLATGDKKRVVLLRRRADGYTQPIPVDIAAIEKGKMPDTTYLVSGDQIFVPGNTLKKVQQIINLVSVASFARIFTGGW